MIRYIITSCQKLILLLLADSKENRGQQDINILIVGRASTSLDTLALSIQPDLVQFSSI